ncbi:MAG: L,D-transpeptidase, partial [Clostridiaceae bacterium]|nr:L,D-transpeptidase [Clostridiaceae bacterium]
YEAPVTYWMPFFGNIGIHDASWRYSFGGEIYKARGSHGCINAPIYLAKTIFENIEEGTPIICYEE